MTPQVLNRRDFPGRLPPRTKLIDRRTPFGNEFIVGVHGQRGECIDLYIAKKSKDPEFIAQVRRELRGFNLMCHCKPRRCHGDWLLLVANTDVNLDELPEPV